MTCRAPGVQVVWGGTAGRGARLASLPGDECGDLQHPDLGDSREVSVVRQERLRAGRDRGGELNRVGGPEIVASPQLRGRSRDRRVQRDESHRGMMAEDSLVRRRDVPPCHAQRLRQHLGERQGEATSCSSPASTSAAIASIGGPNVV